MRAAAEPLGEAAAALRDGRRTPREYVGTLYDRVDATESEVRAWVDGPEPRGRLEAEAAALAERHPDPADRPPLFGVPVGVKDIVHVDGLPTRAGSELPPGVLAGPQADVVARLREAGALVAGKTATTEFAWMAPGPTRNPHDTDHTPGGSSSGSAAAVAAGHCPLALGTQTIGSVVRPATFCGVVGYKPSYDRVPRSGVVPLAPSVDHVGLFTQDVPGLALAASACVDDWDTSAATSPGGERPTLGVPEGPYLDQASRTGREQFEDYVDALEAGGYDVVRIRAFEGGDSGDGRGDADDGRGDADDGRGDTGDERGDADDEIGAVNDRHEALVAAEAALSHESWFDAYGERYAESTADLIRDGRDVSVGTLASARRGRTELRESLHGTMRERGVDVWVSPGALGPAPEGIGDTGDPVMNLPWTHAGLPTVALPGGTVDGLPFGVQCAAAFGADEQLLAWAEGLAAALA